MKKIYAIIALASFSLSLLATEARIESMGSNGDFIKDDISVFDNPATAFGFGNLLVGSLGKVEKSNDRWARSEQWFGGWAVYPLDSSFKIVAGATVNRPLKAIRKYRQLDESNFFTVFNGGNKFNMPGQMYVDYLEALKMGEPIGNVYGFGGLSWNNEFNVAVGGRYAGSNMDGGDSGTRNMTIAGGNLGLTYNVAPLLLEANFNYDMFSLTRKLGTALDASYDESSKNVLMRAFYSLSSKNTLVPVLGLDLSSMFGVSNRDLSLGMGFNRDLFKGFIWAGIKYVNHSAEYPEYVGNTNEFIYSSNAADTSTATKYPSGVSESSHKIVYSFGVEKKMLWDWFTLRVGGNKVFEYLTKKKTKTETNPEYTLEKGLYERDVDAVGWGIAIGTPDDRLKFDITFSEAFPNSNIFAGGENGIIDSRISAALKF
ncbi:MAG: hypothetical protein V1913_02735 [Fibrobacterota bacterium]